MSCFTPKTSHDVMTSLRTFFSFPLLLLGLGCRSTSVCLKIFSVQFLVPSARVMRFSKWASSSVFSAWPSFSSVNWETQCQDPECTSHFNHSQSCIVLTCREHKTIGIFNGCYSHVLKPNLYVLLNINTRVTL